MGISGRVNDAPIPNRFYILRSVPTNRPPSTTEKTVVDQITKDVTITAYIIIYLLF